MRRGGRRSLSLHFISFLVPFYRGRYYPAVFTRRHLAFSKKFQEGWDIVHNAGHVTHQSISSPEDAHPVFAMGGNPWTHIEISLEGFGFYPFALPLCCFSLCLMYTHCNLELLYRLNGIGR